MLHNNTDELEERIEVLEATVVELGEDVNLVEHFVGALNIDVSVINDDPDGNQVNLEFHAHFYVEINRK